TGNPLERATIKILETKQSAYTKSDGIAVISGIQPGTYSVVTSYAGYELQTQKNVIVQSGATTELTFHLSSSAADTLAGRLTPGVVRDTGTAGMSIHGPKGADNSTTFNLSDAEVITGGSSPSQGYASGGILPKKSRAYSAFGSADANYAPPPPMPRDFN